MLSVHIMHPFNASGLWIELRTLAYIDYIVLTIGIKTKLYIFYMILNRSLLSVIICKKHTLENMKKCCLGAGNINPHEQMTTNVFTQS